MPGRGPANPPPPPARILVKGGPVPSSYLHDPRYDLVARDLGKPERRPDPPPEPTSVWWVLGTLTVATSFTWLVYTVPDGAPLNDTHLWRVAPMTFGLILLAIVATVCATVLLYPLACEWPERRRYKLETERQAAERRDESHREQIQAEREMLQAELRQGRE